MMIRMQRPMVTQIGLLYSIFCFLANFGRAGSGMMAFVETGTKV